MKKGRAAAVADGEYEEQEENIFDIGRYLHPQQRAHYHRNDEGRRHRAQRHALVFKAP
ncbi:hypothetical protein SDC9_209650 [bioreactor metagenome]|uniref:Uncharacterized protein n=1 Tax=bioreactor metagenome TaxID=1076179 RepID=A0A645JNJ7_9ZZZZ